MSNFYCEQCGDPVLDSSTGYFAGCDHYKPDRHPTPQERSECSDEHMKLNKDGTWRRT